MRWTAALAPAIGVLMVSTTTAAGPEKISYPESYQDEFIEYLRVDRPDRKIVRFMYVNPAAQEAAQPGEPLPDGTVLVMEDHKARLGAGEEPETDAEGRLVPTDEVTNVFVMEKQPGWGAEYPDDKRNGEWEYAWFLPDGSRKADAQFDGCFECHMSRAASDYTFTFADHLLETRR